MTHLPSQFYSVSHFPSQPQNGCQTSGDNFPEQKSSKVRKENSILLGVLLKALKVFSEASTEELFNSIMQNWVSCFFVNQLSAKRIKLLWLVKYRRTRVRNRARTGKSMASLRNVLDGKNGFWWPTVMVGFNWQFDPVWNYPCDLIWISSKACILSL